MSPSPRQYYVLTHAGKPVWTLHAAPDANMGVVQALISIFAEDQDRPKSITRGKHRIVFLLKAPLYLVCVSDWGEPEHILRVHLEYVYLQILSVVTSTQLARAFQRRSNFDPTRLLEGTEPIMSSLVDRCRRDFSFTTASLEPLRMPPALREEVAACLIPPTRFQDLLYVIYTAGGHIVTVLRPRKHSIHPSDLHLLLNTADSIEGETFLPICLPKFNPAGFVHAFVGDGLIFCSAARDSFEELRAWKDEVIEVARCVASHGYAAEDVCAAARHFVYKSRQLVQITAPTWPSDRDELVTMYQKLQEGLRSGLKLVYMRTDEAAYLGWASRAFELYVCAGLLSKQEMVAAANEIVRVIGADTRVFLHDAPVF